MLPFGGVGERIFTVGVGRKTADGDVHHKAQRLRETLSPVLERNTLILKEAQNAGEDAVHAEENQ